MGEPKLTRGHVRFQLVRELAKGEHTQTELGTRYGVSQQAVSDFAKRHAEQIADVAARLDDEFAGLWIADKANRIAELQQQADSIAELMDDPDKAAKAGVQAAEMLRVQASALKQVAEELGQLPGRVSVTHSGSLSIQLNGVDVGALT